MIFKQYTNVHEFYEDTYDVLMLHESQNMILLGNVIMGHEMNDKTAWRDPANWFMATVSDSSGIQLIALMTPPYNLTLYATENRIDHNAIGCLVNALKDVDIPGVTTEKTLAEEFAKVYTAQYQSTSKISMDQRIYELNAVRPDVKQIGTIRLLSERDMHYFPYWVEAFYAANQYGTTEMKIPHEERDYLYRLSTKKLYVLEVGGYPVSMAGLTRTMQNCIGVSFVYTPPYFRGRGYATSCVAQVSQLALNMGYKKCVLYTDLLNPTSNSIYMKIGYTPVSDSLMLTFEPSIEKSIRR
jgi:hypothetical protein